MQPVQPSTCWVGGTEEFAKKKRRCHQARPADKGGAFVVWEKELYLNEAHRQLSDGRFYQRIPEDATKSNLETVKAFITQAIAEKELSQSANNLIL